MRLKLIVLLSCVAMSSPALAEDASPAFNEWSCFLLTKKALYDFEINAAKVRFNNLNIQEGVALVSKAPTLSFTASVANRTEANIAVSVEMVGILNEKPIFALSGDAGMGFVAPGRNEEVKGIVAAEKGTLGKAGTLCIRVSAYGRFE